MRRSSRGCAARSAPTRGSSQRAATAGVVDSVMALRSGGARRRATACAMAANESLSTACSSRPCGVSTSWRGWRTNSATPSDSSSWRTWWLMAVGVTDSSFAASLALQWRAAASKARSEASGGRECRRAMAC
ncbi:hypothetical protein D3C87_1009800 [compost metagenome]